MEKPVLLVRTVQANIFSLLNEALKDILYEVNFKFDTTGISIKAVNKSHSQFVHLHMNADKFETFTCKYKMSLGIDMIYLYKLIRGVTNEDVLEFSLKESNNSVLKIKILNESTRISKEYDLKLLDIDDQDHNDTIPYNDSVPKYVLNIGTQRFKSMCKELSVVSDIVEITCTHEELRFECNGASAKGAQIIALNKNNPYI